MITNTHSGTSIDEIGPGIYRISTPVPPSQMEGGFSFNQYLIVDELPVLFHTGLRATFPIVAEAIESVMPVASLRYVAFSHFEADECGALNDFLAAAPQAVPLCGRVAAFVSINDVASRPAHPLGDGESISIGTRELEWIDAPHLPHNWETGYLFERSTATLFCGDLFTQGGADNPALTAGDILGSSEAFRIGSAMVMPDAYSYARGSRAIFDRLISTKPRTLACMHGSAWSDGTEDGGGKLLEALATTIA